MYICPRHKICNNSEDCGEHNRPHEHTLSCDRNCYSIDAKGSNTICLTERELRKEKLKKIQNETIY